MATFIITIREFIKFNRKSMVGTAAIDRIVCAGLVQLINDQLNGF